MNTSQFSKFRGKNGVSIALRAPFEYSGDFYPDLYPTWPLINKYTIDGDTDAYTEVYYAQVLSKLDPKIVWNDLKDKTLLCWEKPGDFCHRRLVAIWLETYFRIEIKEI